MYILKEKKETFYLKIEFINIKIFRSKNVQYISKLQVIIINSNNNDNNNTLL